MKPVVRIMSAALAPLVVCACGAFAGASDSAEQPGPSEQTGWQPVDPGAVDEGTVGPAPDDPAPAQAQPSAEEMEELLRRKLEMQERMVDQVDNNPPGPPGVADEPVPETVLVEPGSRE